MKKKGGENLLAKSGVESSEENFWRHGWKQWRDIFGRFLMRQKSVLSELVMIGNVRQ